MSEHLPHYNYQVHWSEENNSYIATVDEFPSLSWVHQTPQGALHGLAEMLVEVVADMESQGQPIPTPNLP